MSICLHPQMTSKSVPIAILASSLTKGLVSRKGFSDCILWFYSTRFLSIEDYVFHIIWRYMIVKITTQTKMNSLSVERRGFKSVTTKTFPLSFYFPFLCLFHSNTHFLDFFEINRLQFNN